MSQYKIVVSASVDMVGGDYKEIVDLVDDWNYSEEDAKKLFTKQEKLRLPDSRNSRNLGSKRGARVTYTQLVPKGVR